MVSANGGSNDMHVKVVSRQLVKASNTSIAPHVLAVSNLDLLYANFPISFFCLYPRPLAGDFNAVVTSFEAALPSFVNHFFHLAGRIVTDPTSGVPEIHCSNQGAELVVGHADTALSSLDFSSTAASAGKVRLPYDDTMALSVQLVSFACGGFSVAWCSSHLLVDGCAMSTIVGMWSEFARTGKLAMVPNHDRPVLRGPRSPPAYKPSFGEAYMPDSGENLVNVLANQCFVERLYYVEARDVDLLRQVASRNGGHVATRMEGVSLYLWKVLAALTASSGGDQCRMGWWVNGRRCVAIASPEHRAAMDAYVGNVTSFAVREAGVDEIRRAPSPEVALMVRKGITVTANEEHFQELVDWMEEHKDRRYLEAATVGLGSPTVTVTWMASFRPDTDFGFGKAKLATLGELSGRQCSAYLVVAEHPGGDRSLFVSAFLWPKLAAALESSDGHIFKPVTAEYLGFRP